MEHRKNKLGSGSMSEYGRYVKPLRASRRRRFTETIVHGHSTLATCVCFSGGFPGP